MGKPTGPTPATVRQVWERDNGSCLRCGTGLRFEDRGYGWSVHHRSPRGMGGSKAPWVNLSGNLVILCGSATTPGGCHAYVETHREACMDTGWLVSRHGVKLPAAIPVIDLDGRVWWLDDVGVRRDRKPVYF